VAELHVQIQQFFKLGVSILPLPTILVFDFWKFAHRVIIFCFSFFFTATLRFKSFIEKGLKIPQWSSEAVNRRTDNTMAKKTDNTMAKRKRTKGQTMVYKTQHKILKIERHEPTNIRGLTLLLRKRKQFLFHMLHPSCYSWSNPVISQSWSRNGPDCDYDKRNISRGHSPTHLWHRYSITVNQVMVATVKLSRMTPTWYFFRKLSQAGDHVILFFYSLLATISKEYNIYTPTKVKHHPIFLSIYFFTSILLKQ